MEKTGAGTKTAKKLSKKETVLLVMHKLEPVLSEYKESFGKKKFQSRLKKAGKLFAGAVPKQIAKKSNLQTETA